MRYVLFKKWSTLVTASKFLKIHLIIELLVGPFVMIKMLVQEQISNLLYVLPVILERCSSPVCR